MNSCTSCPPYIPPIQLRKFLPNDTLSTEIRANELAELIFNAVRRTLEYQLLPSMVKHPAHELSWTRAKSSAAGAPQNPVLPTKVAELPSESTDSILRLLVTLIRTLFTSTCAPVTETELRIGLYCTLVVGSIIITYTHVGIVTMLPPTTFTNPPSICTAHSFV